MKVATGSHVFGLFIILFMLTPKAAEADWYRSVRDTQIVLTASAMAFLYPALYFTGYSANLEVVSQCPQGYLLAYCDSSLNYCTYKRENEKGAVCVSPSGGRRDAQFPARAQAIDPYITTTPNLLIVGGMVGLVSTFIVWTIGLV